MGNNKSKQTSNVPDDYLANLLKIDEDENSKISEQLQKAILQDDEKLLKNILKFHSIEINGVVSEENLLNGRIYKNLVHLMLFAVEQNKVNCARCLIGQEVPFQAFGSALFPDLNLVAFTKKCMLQFDDHVISYDLCTKYWHQTGDIYSSSEVMSPLVEFAIDHGLKNAFTGSFSCRDFGSRVYPAKFLKRIAEVGVGKNHFEMATLIFERGEKQSYQVLHSETQEIHQYCIDSANAGFADWLKSNYPQDFGKDYPLKYHENWMAMSDFRKLVLQDDGIAAIQVLEKNPLIIDYPNGTFRVLKTILELSPPTEVVEYIARTHFAQLPDSLKEQVQKVSKPDTEAKEKNVSIV
jgi:hypothetical protein